jgi:hypothetical protein
VLQLWKRSQCSADSTWWCHCTHGRWDDDDGRSGRDAGVGGVGTVRRKG